MVNKLPSINLLKEKEKSFFEKFISWALTIGRLTVILTEGIALVAFLYRFSLDRQLIDLKTKIQQEQQIVKASKANEDKFRNLQERLSLVSKYAFSGSSVINVFKDFSSFAPSDMVFNNIVISQDRVKMDADVQSITSLSIFIKKLKAHPKVTAVNLDKIENKVTNSKISVIIIASLKK